jgi:hypothetical protein
VVEVDDDTLCLALPEAVVMDATACGGRELHVDAVIGEPYLIVAWMSFLILMIEG